MRLIFFVEGQTEQAYVTRVLAPHLADFGVYVGGAILPITGRHRGKVFKGGGRSFAKARRQFANLLKQHDQADVRFTTMFDLYGLYHDFPGVRETESKKDDPRGRVVELERTFFEEFSDSRVIPHIQLHEFETILLSGPEDLALFLDNAGSGVDELTAAVAEAGHVELVNDGAATAPSKRIERCYAAYPELKTTVGVEWAACVGVARTRERCPHFHEWIPRLERLGTRESGGRNNSH